MSISDAYLRLRYEIKVRIALRGQDRDKNRVLQGQKKKKYPLFFHFIKTKWKGVTRRQAKIRETMHTSSNLANIGGSFCVYLTLYYDKRRWIHNFFPLHSIQIIKYTPLRVSLH